MDTLNEDDKKYVIIAEGSGGGWELRQGADGGRSAKHPATPLTMLLNLSGRHTPKHTYGFNEIRHTHTHTPNSRAHTQRMCAPVFCGGCLPTIQQEKSFLMWLIASKQCSTI